MAQATKKKVIKKKPKVFDLEWVFESFSDQQSFFTKRMFGGLSVYAFDRMVMLIAEDPGSKSYKEKTFNFDIWNGILIPMERENHPWLTKNLPGVIPHPILAKWLYLPLEDKQFEDSAQKLSDWIKKNELKIGIYPKTSKKKSKPKAKKVNRCTWSGDDPIYQSYHDKEWGIPLYDDNKIFEFLSLESAQAGLSWITILKKRENYRKAFLNFDPKKVSRFSEKKIQSLLKNPGIVRNEKKIRAAVNNAKVFLDIQKEYGTFARYMWSFVGGKPKVNKWKSLKSVPATTKESDAFSKDLKSRGFKFVGSTTMYAHMQACGMVNDHVVGCFRYQKIKSIKPRKRF